MFADISELTLMSMVSELFVERVFVKGQVILPQSQYSPTNKFSRTYFATQDPGRFAERIKTKKAKAKKPLAGAKVKAPRPLDQQQLPASQLPVVSGSPASPRAGGDHDLKRPQPAEMSDSK